MIKNIARIGVGVLTTLLALVVLWEFRIVVTYVLISLMLAASMKPLITRLTGKSLFLKIFWIPTYILSFFGLLALTAFTVRASATELFNLAKNASAYDRWQLPPWLGASFRQTILTWLPSPSILSQTIIGPEGELVLPALFGFAQNIGGVLATSGVILILSVYWSTSQVHFERLWLSLLPSEQRKHARDIWQTIMSEVGDTIRSQARLSLLVGFILGSGFWIIGSPTPALLGLIGAIGSLIPFVGGVLIIVPAVISGLFTSAGIGIITVIYTIIMLVTTQIWIKPKLFNRKWDNAILTVILAIALADSFGIMGIIVAPIIAAICSILWDRLVVNRVAAGAASELSDLKERLGKITETIKAMEKPHPPLITNSMARISELMVAAEPLLSGKGNLEPPNPPE
jgi:predicted PurR-regulated permease PerM